MQSEVGIAGSGIIIMNNQFTFESQLLVNALGATIVNNTFTNILSLTALESEVCAYCVFEYNSYVSFFFPY